MQVEQVVVVVRPSGAWEGGEEVGEGGAVEVHLVVQEVQLQLVG